MDTKRKAILLGTQGVGALGVIRSLGRNAIPLITVDKNKSSYGISRYVQEPYLAEEDLLNFLITLAEREEIKPVLFLTSHEFVSFVLEAYDTLSTHFSLPLKKSYLSYFGPEEKWRDVLSEEGYHLPKTIYGRRKDILSRVPQETGLPVLLRNPSTNRQVLFSKQKDRPIVEKYFTPEEKIQIESIILGPEQNSILQELFLNQAGDVLYSSTYEVLRRYPKYHGIITYGRERDISGLPDLAPLLQQMGCTGPVHIEYKIDEYSKEIYIVTVSPIFSLLTEPLISRGINFPLDYYHMACGEKIQQSNIEKISGRPFKRGLKDKYAIASYLSTQSKSWMQVLREWKFPYTSLTFALDDPGPALGELSFYLQGKGKQQMEILKRKAKKQRKK